MFPTALMELKEYKQFVCWMKETVKGRTTKVPYNPVTGELASVTDPSTWVDYYAAEAALGPYDGIGFVLTKNDPYIFIDLDKTTDTLENSRNLEIASYFNSYTEYSPNGGLHIIGKGEIPKGKRNCHREMYSSERYMTITGSALYHIPIREIESENIKSFYEFLSKNERVDKSEYPQQYDENGVPYVIADEPQLNDDDTILKWCKTGENRELFNRLYAGNWTGYPSQSEGDLTLLNILTFYSRNNEQVKRLFLNSGLGQREKARTNYLDRTLQKARDQQVDRVEIIYPQEDNSPEELANAEQENLPVGNEEAPIQLVRIEETRSEQKETKNEDALDDTLLQGMNLVKDVASYLFSQSPRQSKIYSLVNAMGLIAGITGRKYNISNTGLNLYFLMLGASGSGKEGPRTGISRLMHAVTHGNLMGNVATCPDAIKFISGTFAASGQGLLKQLGTWPSFLSWRDEFGGDLERIYKRTANNADRLYKDIMLSAFSKSGKNEFIEGSSYSDTAKNIALIKSPAMSVLFASVPDRVYEVMNEGMISDGFLPRFIIVEETGETEFNLNHDLVEPSDSLIDRISKLSNECLSNREVVKDMQIDHATLAYSKEIRDYFAQIAKMSDETAPLWERAHLKVLKLASIMSFNEDFASPILTCDELYYAFKFIASTTKTLENKFLNHTLGIDDSACIGHIRDAIDKLLSGNFTLPNTKDSVTYKFLLDKRYIPYSLLSTRVIGKAPFRAARDGPTAAFKRILTHLEHCGYLIPSAPPNGSTYKGKLYVKGTG